MSDSGGDFDESDLLANKETPLDLEKLNKMFKSNEVIIHKILAAFQTSFDDFETEFRNAEKTGDTEVMSRLAHSLKGSAGNIRAEALADQAANLQGKIDDGEVLGDSFDDLLGSLDDLNKQIDSLM